MKDVRDRVVEFKRVSASEIAVNPRNWRSHPMGQREAMVGTFEELGFGDVLLCYHSERAGGQLTLVDGHLRKDLMGDEPVPIVVLDYNDAEADKAILVHDPIAGLAEGNQVQLAELVRDVSTGSEGLGLLIDRLATDIDIVPGGSGPDAPDDFPDIDDEKVETEHTCPKCGYEF